MATAPSIIAPGTFRPDSFIVGVNGGPLSADSDCFEDDFICLVHTALEKVLMQSILPLLSILLCSDVTDVFFFVSNLWNVVHKFYLLPQNLKHLSGFISWSMSWMNLYQFLWIVCIMSFQVKSIQPNTNHSRSWCRFSSGQVETWVQILRHRQNKPFLKPYGFMYA